MPFGKTSRKLLNNVHWNREQLNMRRKAVVDKAWAVLDQENKGFVDPATLCKSPLSQNRQSKKHFDFKMQGPSAKWNNLFLFLGRS